MPLLDNLKLRVQAQSGETVITDSEQGMLWNAGTGTPSLVNDGTYGYLWRITGGYVYSNLTGCGSWKFDSVDHQTTVAIRYRVTNPQASSLHAYYGNYPWGNGVIIGSSNIDGKDVRAQIFSSGSGSAWSSLITATAGAVRTVVLRLSANVSAADVADIWLGTTGRSGTSPDSTFDPGLTAYERTTDCSSFNAASGETFDLIDYAFWDRGLTDAEAAAVADDIRTQLDGGAAVNANAGGGTGTSTGSGSGGAATGLGSGAGSAAGGTGTSTGSGTGGAASGGVSGTFTSDAMENNSGSGLLASIAVSWTWYKGSIGSAPTSTTHGTGTTGSDGVLDVTGLPTGAGFLLVRTADSSGVYYQPGTIT